MKSSPPILTLMNHYWAKYLHRSLVLKIKMNRNLKRKVVVVPNPAAVRMPSNLKNLNTKMNIKKSLW